MDLLFSWPPRGGADVDVYYVAQGLQALGHEVRLFFAYEEGSWERGDVEERNLPFPAERISFPAGGMDASTCACRMRNAADAFPPDFILLTEGYFLKIPLILALKEYRVISRCYAHETACHKDILRFKDGAPCPHSFEKTADLCRPCALQHQSAAIKSGHGSAWNREYMAAKAWLPAYYDDFLAAMASLHAVVITTERMRDQVEGLCKRIHVIPHGVDAERFFPAAVKKETVKPVILAPGRMEDPAKGFQTLLDACTMLADSGYEFEVRATLPEGLAGPPWLRPLGKCSHDRMPELYRAADICVVPSLWEEPFGIVALEAMASGLPVCAARVGGLQDIVVHGRTGLLFARADRLSLADALRRLLENPECRDEWGKEGRRRIENRYCWNRILPEYYPALFDAAPWLARPPKSL
jgi:glycosyltransferase involved in cell wall biosynthesis